MANPLALSAEPLRSSASALTSQSQATGIVQTSAAHAYGRLDAGWQSYAREDVDAHQRRADAELVRMQAMIDQLSLAAQRADALIDEADQAAAALFAGAVAGAGAAAPAAGAVGDWLSWLWGLLGFAPAAPPPTFAPSTLSEAQLAALFDDMRDEPDIPFAFPSDGCYARADAMMRRILERYDIDPSALRKVVIQGDLQVPTEFVYQGPLGNDRLVNWGWHIAPAVPIAAADGSTRLMVIDPSLFDRPVPPDEWAAAMGDPNARPMVVDRRVYGLDHFGSPLVLDDAAAQAQTRHTLDEYMGHCIARGHCASDLPIETLDELRRTCVDAGVCKPTP